MASRALIMWCPGRGHGTRALSGTQLCPSGGGWGRAHRAVLASAFTLFAALLVPGSLSPTRIWDRGSYAGATWEVGQAADPQIGTAPQISSQLNWPIAGASNKNNPEIRAGLACPRVEPCRPLCAGGLVSSAASSLALKPAPGRGRSCPPTPGSRA